VLLHKRLRLRAYKFQPVQQLKPSDSMKRQCCVEEMLDCTDHDSDFMKKKIIFFDEAKFHVPGKVHRHNVKIWRTENPHTVRQHIRESP